MTIILLFTGMAGPSIPLIMKAKRMDPAQRSTIILTAVTDIVAFTAFLSLALIFKQYLIGWARHAQAAPYCARNRRFRHIVPV